METQEEVKMKTWVVSGPEPKRRWPLIVVLILGILLGGGVVTWQMSRSGKMQASLRRDALTTANATSAAGNKSAQDPSSVAPSSSSAVPQFDAGGNAGMQPVTQNPVASPASSPDGSVAKRNLPFATVPFKRASDEPEPALVSVAALPWDRALVVVETAAVPWNRFFSAAAPAAVEAAALPWNRSFSTVEPLSLETAALPWSRSFATVEPVEINEADLPWEIYWGR